MPKSTIYLVASLILLLGAIAPVSAEMPKHSSEVVRIVKKSGFLPKNARVSAKITTDNTIILSTYANPKTPDKNLIIDAVLMSKSVIDEFPDVASIRCIFYNPHYVKSYRYVTVSRNTVLQYGSGAIDKKQLIEGLTMGRSQLQTSKQGSSYNLATYIPKGQLFQENRGMILIKLRTLKNAGYNTQKFFSQFIRIEKDYVAKSDIKRSKQALQNLDHSLDTAIREMQLRINLKNAQNQKQSGGMYVERRNRVLDQINVLAQRGKDVSLLMKTYDQTVTPIANNPHKEKELDQALRILENKLRYMR